MTTSPDKFANQLDWNLLRTFMFIVQERSITQAAHRLYLSQPSISGSLRRLEERVGQRLIDRGGATPFRVTEAGESLYRACVEIYGTVRLLPEAIGEAQRDLRGTLNLRVSSHLYHPALTRTIAAFHLKHPNVRFALGGGRCADILVDMRRQGVDLALVSLSGEGSMLEHRLLAQLPMGVYAGPQLTDADAGQASWVDYGDDPRPHPAWEALERYRMQQDLIGLVVAHAESGTRMAQLVAEGIGLGMLVCALAGNHPQLRQLALPMPAPSLPLYLVLHQYTRITSLQQRFVDALEIAFGVGKHTPPPVEPSA